MSPSFKSRLVACTAFAGMLAVSATAHAQSALVVADVVDLGGVSQTQDGGLNLTGGTLQNGTLISSGVFNLGGGSVSAVLAGSGSVVQTAGVTTLSGPNTYAGGTQVNAGTLQIAPGGTLGATTGVTAIATGAVLDLGQTSQTQNGGLTMIGGTLQNGTLISSGVFSLNGSTVSAVLAGAGAVQQNAGVTTLSGANTYTGATQIVGGTLALTGAGSIAHSVVTDNGIFDISNTSGGGASVAGLNGSGSVALGGKTLSVSGSGSFSGVIAGAGGLTITGGTQILTGTNTYAGLTTIAPAGTLQIGNGSTSGSVAGNFADSGTLVFNRSDTVTISGTIAGSGGLTQLGGGTVVLLGNDTLTGRVTITAGNLIVGDAATPGAVLNASSGGVSVGASGTLSGHGTILGAVVNAAGGTVRPGGSIGTLVVGSYYQSASSTLAIEISPTQASLLQVTGTAALAGHVVVTLDQGSYTTHVFPILTAASVTGSFGDLTFSGTAPAGMVYGLSYTPAATEVDLVLATTLTASVYGDAMSSMLDVADGYAQAVLSHRADCAGMSDAGSAAVCTSDGVWMKALGSAGHTSSNAATGGFSDTRGGLVAGLDRIIADGVTAGISLGWVHNSTSSSGYTASAKLDQYDFGVYTNVRLGSLSLDADGFSSSTTNHVSRDSQGAGTATARFNGRGFGTALRLSAPLANTTVTAFGELRWTHQTRNAALESGLGAVDFAIAQQSRSDGHAVLGARYQKDYVSATVRFTPHLEIGLDERFGQLDRAVVGNLATVSGTDFTAAAIDPSRTALVSKLGFVSRTSHGIEFFGDLGGTISTRRDTANGTIGARLRF